MNDALLQTLLTADHPTACEAPPDFNWREAIERVRSIQPQVEAVTDRTFEIDENVQDASFFTDLATYLDESNPNGHLLRHTVLALRFSAFGKLFTVWSNFPPNEKLDADTIDTVIQIAEEAGFVYVPAEGLDSEYSGPNSNFIGSCWGIRFFDYL